MVGPAGWDEAARDAQGLQGTGTSGGGTMVGAGHCCAYAGIEDVRLHDLRHPYASGGLLLGEGLPMIGKLLGHTPRYRPRPATPTLQTIPSSRLPIVSPAGLPTSPDEPLTLSGRADILFAT